MKTKTKTHGILKNLIIIFILIGAATAVSGAEDVTLSIDFEDSSIGIEDDAILIVEIENEENYDISADIEIWAEEYEDDGDDLRLLDVSEDILDGETKEFSYTLSDLSNKWDPYRCGSHRIIVEVEGEEKTETLRISGRDFKISISPSEPSVSDEIKITIEDRSGDELNRGDIIIKNLDTEDSISERTDSDGEFKFTPDEESEFDDSPAGTYEVMVDNYENEIEDHCSTKKTFIIKYKVDKNNIEVIDPKLPDVPQVNEQVIVKITTTDDKPARFINVTVSGPNFNNDYQTNSDGLFYFLPESIGNYNVKITDKRYSEVTKTIAIGAQSQLSISFSPDPEIGKKLTVIVEAEGKAVKDAEVTVTDPEGDKKSDTTDSSGKAEFDVLALTGKYTITAKKSGYADVTKEKKVENPFKITVPESANVGDTVQVKVLDENNDPVSGATVKGENFDLNKKTDSGGVVEFKIEELKDYEISIEKEGFTTAERTIAAEGELTIKLTPEKPQKNKDLTITILAGDMEITSNIRITKPDGTTDEVESSYTFTPEQVGKYTITASKSGYGDVSSDFDIMHNKMKLEYDTVDGNLVFKITTDDNKPVSGAEVGIYVKTNQEGLAELKLDNNYNVTVIKDNYETTKGTIQVPKTVSFSEIFVAILILVLILIILILLLRGRKEGTEKTGLKR